MTTTFQAIQRQIERASALAAEICPNSDGERRMLAAFDSLVLAVEMLNDEVRRRTIPPVPMEQDTEDSKGQS